MIAMFGVYESFGGVLLSGLEWYDESFGVYDSFGGHNECFRNAQ